MTYDERTFWTAETRAKMQDDELRGRMTTTIAERTADRRPEDQVDMVLGVLGGEWNAADRFRDPDLRPEAETARRQQIRAVATTVATETVTTIATDAAREADAANKALDAYRLRVEDTDATAAGLAWEHSVRPTLDASPAGAINWDQVVGNASEDELSAILRFGKSWVRRSIPGSLMPQTRDAQTEQTWSAIVNAVQRRHIDIHPDQAARDAYTRARQASATAATTGLVAGLFAAGRISNNSQLASATLSLRSTALLAGSTISIGGRA